jgi:hypothetical protein
MITSFLIRFKSMGHRSEQKMTNGIILVKAETLREKRYVVCPICGKYITLEEFNYHYNQHGIIEHMIQTQKEAQLSIYHFIFGG